MATVMRLACLLIQGMGSKTIFCGDGINDLPALAAADVGVSVGATDAVIAAAVSTPQGSVAGATAVLWVCSHCGSAVASCRFSSQACICSWCLPRWPHRLINFAL